MWALERVWTYQEHLTLYNLFAYVLIYAVIRNSHLELLFKEGILSNFAKFTGKRLCRSSHRRCSINKALGLRPATLLKKRVWLRCFPVNFAKFPRTPFITKHFRWLILTYLFMHFCVRKKSFIKIPTLILHLKLQTSIFDLPSLAFVR